MIDVGTNNEKLMEEPLCKLLLLGCGCLVSISIGYSCILNILCEWLAFWIGVNVVLIFLKAYVRLQSMMPPQRFWEDY